jgi:hypothetical protein
MNLERRRNMKPKRLLSWFLVALMVLSLCPGAALGAGAADPFEAGLPAGDGGGLTDFTDDDLSVTGEVYGDIEITAFAPITIDGGVAGAASYADAAAVIAHLNGNHASVTANDGEVSVPVTEWAETDAYDPATAGSYTFTATLGEIPEGYANPGGLTATAEVVVAENAGIGEGGEPEDEGGTEEEVEAPLAPLPLASGAGTVSESVYGEEITAFAPITINGGIAGAAVYADAAAVIDYLEDHHDSVTAQVYGGGTISVPVAGWTATDAYNPAAAGSYTFTAALGEIPAGYVTPAGVTATAEVVLYAADSTVTKVTIDNYANENGITNFVLQGKSIQLNATVAGENNPSQDVTWSISGHKSESTAINSDGVLTAGADETSTAIKVTAA